MKNVFKTGSVLLAALALSLVGFTTARGYGGSCTQPIVAPPGGLRAYSFSGPATTSQFIGVSLWGGNAGYYSISNTPDFAGASMQSYRFPFAFWTLSSDYGQKTVYVRYYNSCGQMPQTVSFGIAYHRHYNDGAIDDEINNIIAKFHYGDTDPQITVLQKDLMKLGFMPRGWVPTNHWGPYTDAGVHRYRASKGE